LDVIHGDDGPWHSSGRVSSIGPGLVLRSSGSNSDDCTAGDTISMDGETTGDSFAGFPDWFGYSNVYNDADGTAITRVTAGNAWSIPEIYTAAASGSEVVLDLDAHFGRMADILPQRVKMGRAKRKLDSDEGVAWADSLVAIGDPSLINEASRDSQDSVHWTNTIKMTMEAAKQTKLFGVSGFSGMVYNSPTMGQIAFQADSTAAPYKLRIIDPNSWFWLTMGKGMYGIEWLKTGGSRFTRRAGDNSRPTFFVDASAWTAALLVCDQPACNAELTGVKSSLE